MSNKPERSILARVADLCGRAWDVVSHATPIADESQTVLRETCRAESGIRETRTLWDTPDEFFHCEITETDEGYGVDVRASSEEIYHHAFATESEAVEDAERIRHLLIDPVASKRNDREETNHA